jgi:hypothetical protein
MFILKSIRTDSILCRDGEMRASCLVGPNQYEARIYKTRAGAERGAAARPWRRVVELDKDGCEVALVDILNRIERL